MIEEPEQDIIKNPDREVFTAQFQRICATIPTVD
jgi:hypothetical protein